MEMVLTGDRISAQEAKQAGVGPGRPVGAGRGGPHAGAVRCPENPETAASALSDVHPYKEELEHAHR